MIVADLYDNILATGVYWWQRRQISETVIANQKQLNLFVIAKDR